jgi:hypothetical protein
MTYINRIQIILPRRIRILEICSVAIFCRYLGLLNDFQMKLKRIIDYIALIQISSIIIFIILTLHILISWLIIDIILYEKKCCH